VVAMLNTKSKSRGAATANQMTVGGSKLRMTNDELMTNSECLNPYSSMITHRRLDEVDTTLIRHLEIRRSLVIRHRSFVILD
jgi:hypothetical protein